jgi:hypothetical protein
MPAHTVVISDIQFGFIWLAFDCNANDLIFLNNQVEACSVIITFVGYYLYCTVLDKWSESIEYPPLF